MLTLVKTMKTLCLSNRMDWTRVNKRVLGVQKLDDVLMAMVFNTPEYGETRLLSNNHSCTVAFVTHHSTNTTAGNQAEDVESIILNKILESSGINSGEKKSIYIIKRIHNYFVFRIEHDECINNMYLEYRLSCRGIKTILDYNVYRGLIVRMKDITWHFLDSGKIFAIVGDHNLEDSRRLAMDSWNDIIG